MNSFKQPRLLSNNYFLLTVWIFLFLVVRLSLLWAFSEDLFWYEDLYQGTIAKEILNGSKFPLWDWQALPHEGGTLWIGLAASLFFKLFGPTYFALKLVPITFGLITLSLVYGFLARHFSKRSANIAACLMVFGAPAYVKLRMLAVGTHPSSGFLWLLALWSFYEAMACMPQTRRRSRFFLVLTGIFSGLGLGYAYIVGIGVAALATSWLFWNPRSLLSKNFFYFLGGFLAGYSPTILYNANHHWAGVHWFIEWFAAPDGSGLNGIEFLKRILFLFFKGIPLSFDFESIGGISKFFLSAPYGSLIAGAFLLGCWKNKNSKKMIPFLIYPVFFITAYALSPWYSPDLGFSYVSLRYYAPMQRILLIGAAIGLAGISKDWLRRAWLGFLLILAVFGQISMLKTNEWRNPAALQGYSYYSLGTTWAVFQAPFPEKYDEFIRSIQDIDQDYRHRIYSGYFRLETTPTMKDVYLSERVSEILEMIKKEAGLRRFYLSKILGRYIFYHKGLDIGLFTSVTQALDEQEKSHFYAKAFKDISSLDLSKVPWDEINTLKPANDWFAFALGFNFSETQEWATIKSRLPPALIPWAYRGAGTSRGQFWHSGIPVEEGQVIPEGIPEEFEGDYFWGFGWGASNYFPAAVTPTHIQDFLKSRDVKEESIQKALEGFESYRQWQKGQTVHPR